MEVPYSFQNGGFWSWFEKKSKSPSEKVQKKINDGEKLIDIQKYLEHSIKNTNTWLHNGYFNN